MAKKKVKKPAVKKSKLTQAQKDQNYAAQTVDQELAPVLAGLNQQQTQAQAALNAAPGRVDQALAPTLAEITRQGTQATADAARRQAFTTALTQTVAGMAGAYAPAVQSTYQQAGENQSAFGKGFSDAFKSQQNAAAAQTNQTLQQSGAPAAQMLPGDTGAADALYGIGGYEPASTFNREGAGWTAAAAQLPTTTGLAGQQYLRAAQTQDAQTMSDIQDQATQVELKRPGMISDLTDPLQSTLDNILGQQSQAKLKRPGLINDVLGQLSTNRSKAEQQAFDNRAVANAFGLNTIKAQTDAQYKAAQIAATKRGQNVTMRGQDVTKRGQDITKQGKDASKKDKFWTVRSSAFSDAKAYAEGSSSLLGLASTGQKTKKEAARALYTEYAPRLKNLGYSEKRVRTVLTNALNAAYGKSKKG